MNRDEYQGHQLITLGWATQDLVNQAWHSPRQAHQDICEVLLAWGRITPEQAAHIRHGAQQHNQSGQSSSSGSVSRTIQSAQSSSGSSGYIGIPQTVAGSQGLESFRSQERDWNLGVGPYAIIREISRGGMGIVFHAKHKQSGQDAALKVMLSSEASDTDRARFDREAKALQGFTHPNIVKFYDAGVDTQGNEPYFAMELVKGRDLKEVIKSHEKAHGAMPDLPWMLRVIKPIASALARCHSKQIIHRDLKPQNILIEESTQRPVLVDFGLVKRSKKEGGENFEHSLTKAGDVVGTPAYMAPEQLDPEEFGKPDHSTDTWGFGGILLYCLTGQAPYKGSTNFNIYKKVMTESPPRARSLNKDVPPWLDELCAQCFQRDRKLRPTMEQIVDDLERDPLDFSGSQSSKKIGVFILIAALICVGIATALVLSNSSTELTALSPQSIIYTKDSVIELEIQTGSELDLVIQRFENGQWLPDPAGDSVNKSSLIQYFRPQLKEGKNLFRVQAAEDNETPPLEFEIYRDQMAPTVQFAKRCKVWPDVVFFNKFGILNGEVKDSSPCTVIIQGAEISSSDGQFRVTLKNPESLRSIAVEAKDQAGNEWQGQFQLRPLSDKKAYEALLDRKKWNRSSSIEQDSVIKEVARRLGSNFKKVSTARYRAGNQFHRIATFQHKVTGLELNLIPGGSYDMGVEDDEAELRYCREQAELIKAELTRLRRPNFPLMKVTFGEKSFNSARPYHRVSIPPFLIGRYEVSKAQWDKGNSKERAPIPGDSPMVFMTFPKIEKWLQHWKQLRLPSESEWEYACRAGTTTRYFWGDKFNSNYCWYWKNNGVLHRQAGPWTRSVYAHKKLCNAFGLADMLGNVWEMCEDDYFGSYKGAPNDGRPWLRKGARQRFVRRGGGALYGGALFARSAARGTETLEVATNSTGFRVAASIPGLKRSQK